MKSSVLAIALLLAGPALAQAPADTPPPPSAEQRAAKRMDHLAVLLDLTDAQKAQVVAVMKEEHQKANAFFQQARSSGQKPSRDQMKAEHEQLKAETEQKLSSVLSADQMKKFKILMEEHGPGRFGPHGPGGPGGDLEAPPAN